MPGRHHYHPSLLAPFLTGLLALVFGHLFMPAERPSYRPLPDQPAAVAPVPAGVADTTVDAAARGAGVDGLWLRSVYTRIDLEEYYATANDRGLQAPNRQNGFRTYFGDGGIEVVPRTDEGGEGWSFTWRTTAWGRHGRLRSVTAELVDPQADRSKVTYARGELVEWYENSKGGLEQGFSVNTRPAGEGPLRIEGALGGSLNPERLEGESGVDLLDTNGARRLRYAALCVKDAAGHEVASRLELTGNEVALLIEDQDAAYPLTVDPLMTSPSWTAESNQASAHYGRSLLTAGDVNGDGYSDVIVGAPDYDNGESDEGRACVYLGSAGGLLLSPSWTAEGDQAGAFFGTSVSTAGDVNADGYDDVIVGAPGYDNGQSDEGRAYVYQGSPGGLSLAPSWTAEGDQIGASLGVSVGTTGDSNGDGCSEIIVGAPGYDNSRAAGGRAIVYKGTPGGLSTGAGWTADGDQDGAEFGRSLGTAGDVNGDGHSDLIVGAPGYDNAQIDAGRAYVYLGSVNGFSDSAVWTAEGDQAGAAFGSSVATAGDMNGDGYSEVIVGTPGHDNGQTDEGRACLYLGSGKGPSEIVSWVAEGDQAGARFGSSVGTAGDVNGDGYSDVIVGAPGYDNGQSDEGRASVYQGSGSGLSAGASWTAESNQSGGGFGGSAGTAGDVNGDGYSDVIVGADRYDGGQSDEGRAYAYHGAAGGLGVSASWTAVGGKGWAYFGHCVRTAGDVNGDGYSDVIIGAPGYDASHFQDGRALLYLGSAAGLSQTPAWTAEGDQAYEFFGVSVGTAGDVNWDGCSDVIVGDYRADHGQTEEGRVHVYYGSQSGLPKNPSWSVESNQAFAWMGYSVGTAGDVNGDGYSDVILGAGHYSTGQTTDGGRVDVYYGSSWGLSTSPDWTVNGDQEGAAFGVSVATAGDVNGDGYSDVIVGAPYYEAGAYHEGRVDAFYGSPAGLSTAPDWTVEGNLEYEWLGFSVGSAGDVNGDGYSDVIVGAPFYGQYWVGRAFVYLGSPSGIATSPAWALSGNQGSARYGISVSTAGDVNGDGYSDVIVGTDMYDGAATDEGRAYLYKGSPSGLSTSPSWIVDGTQTEAYFGWAVGAAGDVNGDGFSDVLVGEYYYTDTETYEGRVHLFYGNAGGGLQRLPQQVRTDDLAPICLLGLSDVEDGFRLKAMGRTPLGRGQVCMQFEVKRSGIPFDGTDLITGSCLDTGVPATGGSAVQLSELVTGLTTHTLYHWRLRTLSDSPLCPRSPWFSLPYNSVTEADLRVGHFVSDVPGAAGEAARLLEVKSAPNPFAGAVTLTYEIPTRGEVRLTVYDVGGGEVASLAKGTQEPGLHAIRWDGTSSEGTKLPAGVYFGRLQFGGQERTSKIVLAR